jgi:hypothetical protein
VRYWADKFARVARTMNGPGDRVCVLRDLPVLTYRYTESSHPIDWKLELRQKSTAGMGRYSSLRSDHLGVYI